MIKKISIFITLTLCLVAILAQTAAAYNSLSVSNPQRWDSQTGTIETALFVVKPQGVYYSCELFLTYSAKGTTGKDTDSLEVVHNFDLPANAFVTDAWLWVGNELSKALHISRNEATNIYEGIVQRRRDPLILTKNSSYDNSYNIKVYPMRRNEVRRIKIAFSVPAQWAADFVTMPVLLDIVRASKNTANVMVRVESDNKWGAASIKELPDENATKNLRHVFNVPDSIVKTAKATYTISFKSLINDGVYFNTYVNDKNEGYYEVVTLPSVLFNKPPNRKVAIYLDYVYEREHAVSETEVLEKLKNSLLKNLQPQDSFSLFYNDKSVPGYKKWLAATETNINTVFANVDIATFHAPQSDEQIITNLKKTILTANESYGNSFILFVTNAKIGNNTFQYGSNSQYGSHDYFKIIPTLNDLLPFLVASVPIHVVQLQMTTKKQYRRDKNWAYLEDGATSWYAPFIHNNIEYYNYFEPSALLYAIGLYTCGSHSGAYRDSQLQEVMVEYIYPYKFIKESRDTLYIEGNVNWFEACPLESYYDKIDEAFGRMYPSINTLKMEVLVNNANCYFQKNIYSEKLSDLGINEVITQIGRYNNISDSSVKLNLAIDDKIVNKDLIISDNTKTIANSYLSKEWAGLYISHLDVVNVKLNKLANIYFDEPTLMETYTSRYRNRAPRSDRYYISRYGFRYRMEPSYILYYKEAKIGLTDTLRKIEYDNTLLFIDKINEIQNAISVDYNILGSNTLLYTSTYGDYNSKTQSPNNLRNIDNYTLYKNPTNTNLVEVKQVNNHDIIVNASQIHFDSSQTHNKSVVFVDTYTIVGVMETDYGICNNFHTLDELVSEQDTFYLASLNDVAKKDSTNSGSNNNGSGYSKDETNSFSALDKDKKDGLKDNSVVLAPNPFTDYIYVRVAGAESVQSVKVYDNKGGYVQTLLPTAAMQSNETVYEWDGNNSNGIKQAGGVYIITVSYKDGSVKNAKVVLK